MPQILPTTITNRPLYPAHFYLARILQNLFAIQAREAISTIGMAHLRGEREVNLSHWVSAMSRASKPFMVRQWEIGMATSANRIAHLLAQREQPVRILGSKMLRRLVVKSPSINMNFNLLSPRVYDAVDAATFKFCQETNDTVVGELEAAIIKLRKLMKKGLKAGDALSTLQEKIMKIFTDPFRAFRIAVTETTRALNGGQLLAAKDSGVVGGKRWNCSWDACKKCLTLDGLEKSLDEPFYVDPKGGPYAVVQYPPLHPHCFCFFSEIIGDFTS